tara:strand:- start:269185 stop:270513 length:1329 start_codon:yes stop_codon:yes gene_type:complete
MSATHGQSSQLREQLRIYTGFPFNPILSKKIATIFAAKINILFNLLFERSNNTTFEGINRTILKNLFLATLLIFFFSCKSDKKKESPSKITPTNEVVSYATGFEIEKSGDITVLKVSSAWVGAEKVYSYALVPKTKLAAITLDRNAYDAIIPVPVERMVVTSTTHIPSLEALGVSETLVGFPNTSLISSMETRKRISNGAIKELGSNESINTEMVIELQPEVVVGFGINNQNKAYQTIERSNIPIVYNGDWTENSPLGKAEWIKFFAPFFELEQKADSIFKDIESSYLDTKKLVENVSKRPTVLTGGLYKDVWHVAGGNSWMSQFLKDAKADYLWADSKETGGLSLSLESVLEKAKTAEFWLNPSMHVGYNEMLEANRHYGQFDAFKNKSAYSNTIAKGPTGGLLYYELAPNRPDMVLKDLIHIFHPEVLPDHQLYFFKPLQ